jgi:hypothetical protein
MNKQKYIEYLKALFSPSTDITFSGRDGFLGPDFSEGGLTM